MGVFARSIVLIAALLPSAGATTITIVPADNIAQATAERNSWLTETFGAGTIPHPLEVDIDNVTPGKSNGVVKLELLTSFHSLYFFVTGVDANLQIRTADGVSAHIQDTDGAIYFVGITSSTALGSIQWQSHDSFVLKDFGIPQTPEAAPELATWLCVATGLIVIMRRCKAPSAPSPTALWIWRSAKLAQRLRGESGRGNRARS